MYVYAHISVRMWCGVIWPTYIWLNKFYSSYIATTVSIVGMALELKSVVEIKPIKLKECYTTYYFHFNHCLKQLYICK